MSQLAPLPVLPPPGVVATESALGTITQGPMGRWVLPHGWFRFVRGRAQKMGGWVQAFATPTSGQPRAMWAWRDNNADIFLAAGTYRKLYVYDPLGVQNDITPFRSTGTLGNNPFTTSNGSNVVTVNNTNHGVNPGDTAIYAGATAFNNVTMNGTFIVQTIIDTNNYTVLATTTANASGSGGGNAVTFQYEITVGVELGTFGYGWGVGPWGLGTWGTARTQSTIFIEPRFWGLDNFGKILLAAPGPGGSLYQFDPTQAQPWPRAQLVVNAPITIRQIVVTPEEFVFALCDNMTVNSCTQGDFTTWTPSSSNTAFSRTLAIGSKLIGARVLQPFITLVWSDAALFRFQYTGDQFIYQSSMVAKDCGLIGPGAAVAVNGIAFWQGTDNFWFYNGQVQPIPNVEDIRKYVFDQVSLINGPQCVAAYNPKYNEVWFFMTLVGQVSPTLLAIYHITDNCWSLHSLTRVGGTHFNAGDTRPYMGDSSGFIYQHENTFDGNGSPITTTLTLAPFPLGNEGVQAMDVEGMLFDTYQQSGNIYVTLNTFDRMTDLAVEDTETDTIPAAQAGLTDVRVAGRYLGMTISQVDLGSYFRWGRPALFVRPTAMRR